MAMDKKIEVDIKGEAVENNQALHLIPAYIYKLADIFGKSILLTKIKECTTTGKIKNDSLGSTVVCSESSVAQDSGKSNNRNVTTFSLKKFVEKTKNLIAAHR